MLPQFVSPVQHPYTQSPQSHCDVFCAQHSSQLEHPSHVVSSPGAGNRCRAIIRLGAAQEAPTAADLGLMLVPDMRTCVQRHGEDCSAGPHVTSCSKDPDTAAGDGPLCSTLACGVLLRPPANDGRQGDVHVPITAAAPTDVAQPHIVPLFGKMMSRPILKPQLPCQITQLG